MCFIQRKKSVLIRENCRVLWKHLNRKNLETQTVIKYIIFFTNMAAACVI